MELTADLIEALRGQFPSLSRTSSDGGPVVYFDGPAGTQVPQRVVDAIADYLSNRNANHGGLFETSIESDRMLDGAHQAAADFLGSDDPGTVFFGANMTTLTMSLSRALARTWRAGDEIVLTRLEHDANYSPWVLAARDGGVTVHMVDIHPHNCTLKLDDFPRLLNARTRLVAVGCASNAAGTINPVQQICQWARDVGALTFLDAVHYAPHALMDVQRWGCDFLACSAYKFFGPHIGILYGRREHLERLEPYKLRPAPETLPGRWMTGTQNHACIAGTMAAIDYLADLGRTLTGNGVNRRAALEIAFAAIRSYEQTLADQLLDELLEFSEFKIHGITEREQRSARLPTLSMTHSRWTSRELASRLAEHGIFAWHGNYYALPLTERIGVEPNGMLRIGMVHYNTPAEIERVVSVLKQI